MTSTSPVASETSEQSHTTARSWVVVVIVGVMAAVHIWKLPIALPLLEEELEISLLASGILLGIIQLASMLGGLLVAWGGEIAGLRRLLVVGLLLLAAGSLSGAFTSSIRFLMLYRTLEGVGFLLCTVLAPALIRRTCEPARLNIAMSAWGAFQGTATVIGFAGGGLLLQATGWRGVWFILGIATLLLIIPLLQFTSADPQHQSGNVLWTSAHRIITTIRTWRPWVAGLTFASYTLQWMAVMGFLPTVFADADMAPVPAALLSAVVGGVNVIGAFMAGRLLIRGAHPRGIIIATFGVMAISSLLFFAVDWQSNLWGLSGQMACALVFSMIGGTVPAIISRLAVDLAPSGGSVAAVIGLMQQLFNIGNFLGPMVLAWVALTAGSWNASWWVTCSFSAVGILCIWILTRSPRRPSPEVRRKPGAPV